MPVEYNLIINHQRDEIINLRYLKIGKFHRALRGPVGRPVPTSFSIVRPWTRKKTDYRRRSVRSYLQDGRTGRFGTLAFYENIKPVPGNRERTMQEKFARSLEGLIRHGRMGATAGSAFSEGLEGEGK